MPTTTRRKHHHDKTSHPSQFETMSESGAYALRDKIERYWRERGVAVAVRVEYLPWTRKDGGGWVIRSNIFKGAPW